MESEVHLSINTKFEDSSRDKWEEVRIQGAHPSRRSYHSAVAWENNMIVAGGQDLREGAQPGCWMLKLAETSWEAESWEELPIEGMGSLCRHSAVVNGSTMYLFGGCDEGREFNRILVIDLETYSLREVLPDSQDCPPPIDSHTACLYNDGTPWMVVFGGFKQGIRSNDVFVNNLTTLKWKKATTSEGPVPRSNHSAVVYKDALYVFGGADEEGEKLNDFWKLDLRTYQWEQIQARGSAPTGRSGHSAVIYKDLMVVFGGMKDITKETNDMFSYDFNTNTWIMFQYEHQVEDPISHEEVEMFKKARNSPPKQPSPKKSPGTFNRSPTSPKKEDSDKVNFRKKRTLYEGPVSPLKGRVRGKVPHARDGHSAVLIDETMFIFGGDRHQMPFNDVYAYPLDEKTIKTPLVAP